ncbi:GntR family transcriptional regulator [Labrys wisconsinensis]|uniref:DNA-binding GntR family transcriptional regulator n=1 Tax=Labrys wisconsinensis TaxID=425677 RepID=A0ABU0JFJ4_9HYPH|nr:GntR family transcriptional regulator [Labrys wisconsinensis]MDQ0472183.1 DNA-binding GntR family transcriptional regulator [Labrys wisconsinensis]
MPGSKPRQPAQRRYEIVEDVLRANIRSGRLPEGLVLLEGPIADIFQTSRAPVQRALLRLEAEQLVRRFKGRGYLVGPPGRPVAPLRTDIKALGLVLPRAIDEALQSRSTWERIYESIEADVAACVVFGRYRIIEIELAEHFDVSRTVVRDVLGRLQERGLVRKNQSSHWIAGPLTAKSIKDRFALRRILEPPALVSAAPRIDRSGLTALLDSLSEAERAASDAELPDREDLETRLVETCVMATPNERLRELIRDNLLPVTASERLLRQLGLPRDRIAIAEYRLIVELLARGAIEAAAAMLDAHLEEAMNRNIAQMKIVAVIPTPRAVAPYLTRVSE